MNYEAKSTVYNEKMQIYLAVSTDDINPIAIKEDLDLFKEFLLDKYVKEIEPDKKPKNWLFFLKNKNAFETRSPQGSCVAAMRPWMARARAVR